MSLLGKFFGELAGAIFPGAQGMVEKVVDQIVERVKVAATNFVRGWEDSTERANQSSFYKDAKAQRNFAQDLADEERELAAKKARDKRRTEADAERLDEIAKERERLRRTIDETTAAQSAKELVAADDLASRPLTDADLEGNVGLLSSKVCPRCGSTMTLQFHIHNVQAGSRLKWVCSSIRLDPCPFIFLTKEELARQVAIREPHADLDATPQEKQTWRQPEVVKDTAGRVRGHLGDEDQAVVCPRHLLPMKLLPMANAGGLLLDSYQYTCLGVDAEGKACNHTVPVKSFGQVSALLTRYEGRGIL